MTRCAYCGEDTLDAHQIEVCRDCCACREDLANEQSTREGLMERIPADDFDGPVRCNSAMTERELLEAIYDLRIPHDWEFSAFGGGWACFHCNLCGQFAIGSTRKWDLLARLWPARFHCGRRRAARIIGGEGE